MSRQSINRRSIGRHSIDKTSNRTPPADSSAAPRPATHINQSIHGWMDTSIDGSINPSAGPSTTTPQPNDRQPHIASLIYTTDLVLALLIRGRGVQQVVHDGTDEMKRLRPVCFIWEVGVGG